MQEEPFLPAFAFSAHAAQRNALTGDEFIRLQGPSVWPAIPCLWTAAMPPADAPTPSGALAALCLQVWQHTTGRKQLGWSAGAGCGGCLKMAAAMQLAASRCKQAISSGRQINLAKANAWGQWCPVRCSPSASKQLCAVGQACVVRLGLHGSRSRGRRSRAAGRAAPARQQRCGSNGDVAVGLLLQRQQARPGSAQYINAACTA